MQTLIKIVLIFIVTALEVCAQSSYKFIKYSNQDGLCHDDVLSMCQDKYGFIWIGTKTGCSRFDGIVFKNYQFNEKDQASIAEGWINIISKDNDGNLWFAFTGKEKTLMRYDYDNDYFIDYTDKIKHLFKSNNGILSIWSLFIDSKDRIWFEPSIVGLICVDSKSWKKYAGIRAEKLSIIKDIKCFFEDNDSNIWIAGNNLFCIQEKTKKIFQFTHNPKKRNSISSNVTKCVFQDSEGQIWIGTYNGLNKLTSPLTDSAKFQRFYHDPQNPNSLPSNLIYDITEDRNGNLIIATINGLCLFDKKQNTFIRFYKDEIDKHSINSNIVRTVFHDMHQNIWVGTNSGIALLRKNNFTSFTHSEYSNSIAHNKVEFVSQTPDSNILIATPEGIDKFNVKTNEFKHIVSINSGANSLSGSPLVIYPESNNDFWIGTWNGGFSHYNATNNKITNFVERPEFKSISRVPVLFGDSKKRLWVNNNDEKLIVFNQNLDKLNEFIHDEKYAHSISQDHEFCIFEDSKNRIWIGTINGLNLLIDFDTGKFKHYLQNVHINKTIEDKDTNIWIASNKGLFKLNPDNDSIIRFASADGITGFVSNILLDKNNDFWVSTSDIFARFSIENEMIENFTVFRQEDGLIESEFAPNVSLKLLNDNLIFGGGKGFCLFNPDNVMYDTIPPDIVITSFKIQGKEIKAGQKMNGQIVLDKSIVMTRHLSLNYKNNAFSIEFAGLQYNMTQHNTYKYRLQGYEQNDSIWHFTDSKNRLINYMNLPAGEYSLEINAANSYGYWNSNIYKLNITILAPWWLSWWFTVSWIIAVVLIILIIFRLRTNQLRNQKQKLESVVKERTLQLQEMNLVLEERQEELKQQANELISINSNLEKKNVEIRQMAKKLHDTDQFKMKFFANISHEFRTPLSLIITPVEKILSIGEGIDWKILSTNLNFIHRNAKRLQRLTKQIIEFRKMDSGIRNLKVSKTDILSFIDEVVNVFKVLAETKKIELSFDSGHFTLNNDKSKLINDFWFDPDIMEKILFNLISNAIKYTPEGGGISISIGIVETRLIASLRYQLVIKISDTGIGIKPENLDKIFDRFYRVENNELSNSEGTGIGLSYTKELVELHKGSIYVESELYKGSKFIVEFPIGKVHYSQSDINEGNTIPNLNYIKEMIGDIELKTENTNEETSESENKIQNNESPTILLVEDNDDLRLFIKNELSVNYKVLEAGNGEEGWQVLAYSTPDLIISDVMMPVMDGIEFCRMVKDDENTCHIPIILLTAKAGEENIIEGLKSGAGDYITKPFNLQVLKLKIERLIDQQVKLKEKYTKSIDIDPQEITHNKFDKQFMEKAIEIVKSNMEDPDFNNSTFVQAMNYSRATIYRKIKSITGQSINEFIRDIRLKTAAKYFMEGYSSVSDVCYRVGFKHPNTLTNNFTKMFGVSPTQYMNNSREK